MSERVEIDGGFRLGAEFFKEIVPAGEDLADKALSADQIAVRLEIPSAHDMPFSLFDKALDAAEQRGVVLLHPFVKQGFVVAEDEAVVFLAEIGGDAEGGKRFRDAFFDFPEPDDVDVRIAD